MSRQRELMSESFHSLAQPIAVLRATVELGLRKNLSQHASHLVLEDCLGHIDRLMQELALLREIATLDELPPLQFCDGQRLLEDCVQEIAPVAADRGITLRLDAEPALMQCNAAMLQRASFVLLDELIAGAARGGKISLALHFLQRSVFLLEIIPGPTTRQRCKLSRKPVRLAGGNGIHSDSGCTSITFRNCTYPRVTAIDSPNQRLLTPGVVTNIL